MISIDECNKRIENERKTLVKSEVYILPNQYKIEKNIQNFGVETEISNKIYNGFKAERFLIMTNIKIGEGSYGSIFGAKVMTLNNNPLQNNNYAFKLIKKSDNNTLNNISSEINIQNLFYIIKEKLLKTLFIYKKIFIVFPDNIAGFILEEFQKMSFNDLSSIVPFKIFKRDVLDNLYNLYNNMINNPRNCSVIFKHNDLHSTNLLLQYDYVNNKLDYRFIDFGQTYIQKIYEMIIYNNDIINYYNNSKLLEYSALFDILNQRIEETQKIISPMKLSPTEIFSSVYTVQIKEELQRYVSHIDFYDYLLYIVSMAAQIRNNSIIQKGINMNAPQNHHFNNWNSNLSGILLPTWQPFITNIENRYSFLRRLYFQNNEIILDEINISRNPTYGLLWDQIVKYINTKSFDLSILSKYNNGIWRSTILFVEFYLKESHPNIYKTFTAQL